MGNPASISQSPRLSQLIKSALGVAVAWGALTAGQAQAFIVNVEGTNYDVTTFGPDSYNNNIVKFALPANGGVMPWWNNQSLASSFAAALGGSLGYPNGGNNNGPYFAWESFQGMLVEGQAWAPIGAYVSWLSLPPTNPESTWAQVAPMSAPGAPGPLPVIGAAAAFGFSRKLRQRITNAQADSSRIG